MPATARLGEVAAHVVNAPEAGVEPAVPAHLSSVCTLSVNVSVGGVLANGVLGGVTLLRYVTHRQPGEVQIEDFLPVDAPLWWDACLAPAQSLGFGKLLSPCLSVSSTRGEFFLSALFGGLHLVIRLTRLGTTTLFARRRVSTLALVKLGYREQFAAPGAMLHADASGTALLRDALLVALLAPVMRVLATIAVELGNRQHTTAQVAFSCLYTGHGGYQSCSSRS